MVDLTLITSGLTGTAQLLVGPEHTAPFVGSGRIAVRQKLTPVHESRSKVLNAINNKGLDAAGGGFDRRLVTVRNRAGQLVMS